MEYYVLLIILFYFLLLFGLSFWTNTKGTDNDTFFLGNRQSSWYLVSIGMIGTTISGVTFVSVPGLVKSIDMTYMQMVFGYFAGYIVIVYVLLPVYYKLKLTTIYEYIYFRLGKYSYKTSAIFFILSRLIISAAPFYLVVMILQMLVFSKWNIPFWITVLVMMLLVWSYTYKSGLKTIIYTDVLQTICFLVAIVLIMWKVSSKMDFSFSDTVHYISDSKYFNIFVFDNWTTTQNFFKQFFSGMFITIVMSGLDHNIMQKNLSCKNLKSAQKNMLCYGFSFIPINFILLSLGILLLGFSSQFAISLPDSSDQIFPLIASEYLGFSVLVVFIIGIIAAAFSSVDSTLAALTTSVCVDLLDVKKKTSDEAKKIRQQVHFMINVLFILVLLAINYLDSASILHVVLKSAGYTYGPLLGMFMFGLFTSWRIKNTYVPFIAVLSPVLCYAIEWYLMHTYEYSVGYEILLLNGLLTFMALFLIRKNQVSLK